MTKRDVGEFQTFMDTTGEWADSVFAGQSLDEKLEHLQEEVREIRDAPNDLEEYADAQMILLDALRVTGHSVEDLLGAMWEKLEVNKARSWEKYRHVK